MKKPIIRTITGEQGSAMVVALLILVVLTILGMVMIQTTTTELQITRNDSVVKDHFYRAEAAAVEAAQWLEKQNVSCLEDLSCAVFLSQNDVNLATLDDEELNTGPWAMAEVDPDQVDTPDRIVGYRIVDETGLIDLSAATNLHEYKIYGYYNRPGGLNRGNALVEIGYKKRF